MATATAAKPTIHSFALDADHLDAIVSKKRGREATPSQYAAEVAAIKRSNGDGNEHWEGIKATEVNTVEVITRELKKAESQFNKAAGDDKPRIKVSIRPRKDHPKLPPFVAFKVETLVSVNAEKAAQTQASKDAEAVPADS